MFSLLTNHHKLACDAHILAEHENRTRASLPYFGERFRWYLCTRTATCPQQHYRVLFENNNDLAQHFDKRESFSLGRTCFAHNWFFSQRGASDGSTGMSWTRRFGTDGLWLRCVQKNSIRCTSLSLLLLILPSASALCVCSISRKTGFSSTTNNTLSSVSALQCLL